MAIGVPSAQKTGSQFMLHRPSSQPVFRSLCAGIFLLGLAIFLCALSMQGFKPGFLEQVEGHSANSPIYASIRQAYLTPKFALQDYGISLMLVACVMLGMKSLDLRPPSSKKWLAFFTVLPPLTSVLATMYGYHLSGLRFDHPPGDEIAAMLRDFHFDLASFGVLFGWPVLYASIVLRKGYAPVSWVRGWQQNGRWWLMLPVIASGLLLAMALALGRYWEIMANLFWIYFYLSVAVGAKGRAG